jgi:hypothetical protein
MPLAIHLYNIGTIATIRCRTGMRVQGFSDFVAWCLWHTVYLTKLPGLPKMLRILFATLTASLVSTSGRSAWFVGVLAIMVYVIFAAALYLLPPSGAK